MHTKLVKNSELMFINVLCKKVREECIETLFRFLLNPFY